jgi:imidazolonepropionase-like amidohydrolase
MKHFYVLIFSIFFLNAPDAFSQTQPVTGLRDNTPSVYAFTNARIIISPGRIVDKGTIVFRDGIIEYAGSIIQPPPDAWTIDLQGKSVYPGFIDMWTEMGTHDSTTPGGAVHSNPSIRSWFDASVSYEHDEEQVKKMRSQGFILANVVPARGIFRGKTALVNLGGGTRNMIVIKSDIAQAVRLERGMEPSGSYPSSLMGIISLIRQTFHDASWYHSVHHAYNNERGVPRPEKNLALESLSAAGKGQQPVMFSTRDEIDFFRAGVIASEFDLKLWIRGSGYEYRRLQAIKDAGIPIIVPLDFPGVPDIENPENLMNLSLEELRHWDFAPENPGRLHSAGVKIALTSSGSGKNNLFTDQLRTAVERGLDEEAALAALTVTPAEILGIDNKYGTLEAGKSAGFIISSGNIFKRGAKIEEVWIDGARFQTDHTPETDVRGKWKAESEFTGNLIISIGGEVSRLKGTVETDGEVLELLSVKFDNQNLTMLFPARPGGSSGLPGFQLPFQKMNYPAQVSLQMDVS